MIYIVSGKSAFLLEIEKRRKEATINSKSETIERGNDAVVDSKTKSVDDGVFV